MVLLLVFFFKKVIWVNFNFSCQNIQVSVNIDQSAGTWYFQCE